MKIACPSSSRFMCESTECIEKDQTDMDQIGTGMHSLRRPVIPKPSHDMPLRSRPEPSHHNASRPQECELVDEGRRHLSDCSPRDQKRRQQRVTISESPSMQLYHLDPTYERTKSYSKEDYQRFSRDSMIGAGRIKKLVHSLTSSGVSVKESFKYLRMNNVVLPGDIRGIEHLICDSTFKMLQERQDHARDVLLMQHRIETLTRDPVKQGKVRGDIVEILASVSASRSSGSAKHARIRASRAA